MNPTDESPPLIFLLCDYAEVLNAKLYVMGAGFDQLTADIPAAMALAVLWNVPWSMTGRSHAIDISLMTQDGTAFLDSEGRPIQVAGTLEVRRSAQLRPGEVTPTPLAVRLPPIALAEGGYRWQLAINDGEVRASVAFRAVRSTQ